MRRLDCILAICFCALINDSFAQTESKLCEDNWPCKWQVDDYTLDLTGFQRMGLNLTAQDIEYDYYYSPCNNLLTNMSASWYYNSVYNVIQRLKEPPYTINYLAIFDPDSIPSVKMDANNEPLWTFEYTQNFSIQYYCDTDIEFINITDIFEVLPGRYVMRIGSNYVCRNNHVPYNIGEYQCIWTNTGDSEHNYTLDLTSLYGEIILGYDEFSGQNVAYSVCTDGTFAPKRNSPEGICGMYLWYPDFMEAAWNASVTPIYTGNNFDLHQWVFRYYDDDLGKPYPYIIWRCDPTIDPYEVEVGDWGYGMTISSKYSCPKTDCLFVDDAQENVLDLTGLEGTLLEFVDSDFQYSYQYTICQNDVACNDDVSVMAMAWDINERSCDPYLALWEGNSGYNLTYDGNENQWKFSYNNGQECRNIPKRNVQFDIYFRCNASVSNYAVTKVEHDNQCSFAMYIALGNLYKC